MNSQLPEWLKIRLVFELGASGSGFWRWRWFDWLVSYMLGYCLSLFFTHPRSRFVHLSASGVRLISGGGNIGIEGSEAMKEWLRQPGNWIPLVVILLLVLLALIVSLRALGWFYVDWTADYSALYVLRRRLNSSSPTS
ncbi:hypothetical protein ES705_33980 [subsurface metagenome]